MLDGLNKYGLPLKYAILCAFGGVISVFLANMLGYNHGGATYISAVIATGVGGAIGGVDTPEKRQEKLSTFQRFLEPQEWSIVTLSA